MNRADGRQGRILGIDLGTSSVKAILRSHDGTTAKARERYQEETPRGWGEAVRKVLASLDLRGLAAIGLSSQVGTYLVDGRDVIGWSGREGREELDEIQERFGRELFLQEIGMPHPNIISYPLPRLLYIKRHYPQVKYICQPKDFLCELLTGKRVTDPCSWRGLAKLSEGRYSRTLLDRIDFPEEKLPGMIGVCDLAGRTREMSLEGKVLPAGIPVFAGMNDFYASLLGMGVYGTGDLFDITGTSEHLGVTVPEPVSDTELVSSPYFRGHVHYGVTASAGASLDYGMRLFGFGEMDPREILSRKPPIFLPYINGERAPIWDADARGMFFGIGGNCEKQDMAYAVLEGVAFSLYHIYECMGKPDAGVMRVSGGAAANPVLNAMKAELFGVPVLVPEETDTSALGACMAAAVGLGWHADFGEAAEQHCRIRECIRPRGDFADYMRQRFSIYRELYPAVKRSFGEFRNAAMQMENLRE